MLIVLFLQLLLVKEFQVIKNEKKGFTRLHSSSRNLVVTCPLKLRVFRSLNFASIQRCESLSSIRKKIKNILIILTNQIKISNLP